MLPGIFQIQTFWQWVTPLSNTVLQSALSIFHADVCQRRPIFFLSFRKCIQYSNLVSSPSQIRDNAVLINFYLQFFIFILMISGDIEVNPGPMTDNVLDIIHLNIRSIRLKIAHLNTLVHDFDILWNSSHDTVSNDSLSLDSFDTIYRKDRNCYGGGVMIYVSKIFQVHRRSEYEPVGIECLWIEIVIHTCNFFLCCIYRPPHADNRFWTNFFMVFR